MVFLDELATGVAPASSSDVARDLVVPGGLAAGGMITAFHVLALFIETPLLAFSERVPARWFLSGALAVLAAVTLGAALASSAAAFAVCLAVYGVASGCALSSAEGQLVEARPDERERTLARINIAGALGDLAVPALLIALAWLDQGWRLAMLSVAMIAGALALVHASTRSTARPVSDDEGEELGTPAALRMAFSNRRLLVWSIAAGLTSLLDEVLIAFAILTLDHASALERACAVGGWTVGMVGGLVVVERAIDRLEPRRVLLGSTLVAAAALVVLAGTSDARVAIGSMFVLGVSTSPLHPLAAARAYAALPGRPALVNAVSAAWGPIDALAPLLLAAIALGGGPRAAVIAILIAPAGIALAALSDRR